MWYFSWILGLGLALIFGIVNAIWYEIREREAGTEPAGSGGATRKDRGGSRP